MKLQAWILLGGLAVSASPSLSKEKVGEIWDTDRIQRRVEARNYSFFSFGPNAMNNMGVDDGGVSVTYGHIWETTPYAAIKLGAEGAFYFGDENASIAAGTLGANFYLTPTEVSPYVGFDLGYGAAATDVEGIDNVSGWAGGATVGVALFRTSSVQMHITARYLQIFTDNKKGQPSQGTLGLGVAF
ncbi:outer membrane beta-barrel protein [Pseudobacteriovorax antillogorgiicola]|uniref:Uncharacterized protein n=1 Tax=Pseudobacteriovorax antillogorgiicola TaxID=1513793 RepID=A0A1Y6CHL0_9BACT|nr:outer membrane beta-barrel protein [Pseudobacteriovorax antillogorgiicola]TCS46969.1 outer membrane protein with beta-barrel domain [Pseudobacteriovorax antillogorgiicola]SMF64653.1 hypothetical protein SAMN06296036_12264 [Pseudobacteriovorax antillogorgiicola]